MRGLENDIFRSLHESLYIYIYKKDFNTQSLKLVFDFYIEILLSSGSDYQIHEQVKQPNDFLKIVAYHEIQDNTELKNWQEYVCQPHWYIRSVSIDTKPIFYRT